MKRLVLHQLIETDDSFEEGPAVGQILLGDDGPRVQAATAALREQLQAVLDAPLTLRSAAPGTFATVARTVSWEDGDAFVTALIERLEQKDVRLRGRLAD